MAKSQQRRQSGSCTKQGHQVKWSKVFCSEKDDFGRKAYFTGVHGADVLGIVGVGEPIVLLGEICGDEERI